MTTVTSNKLGAFQTVDTSNGAVQVTSTTKQAGERNTSSSTTDYTVTQQEVNCTVVSLADNTTTVYAGPAFLYGVFVNTIPTTTTLITDGATTKYTLPAASLTANTYKVLGGGHAVRFDTSLIINPDDAETVTDLLVFWRPQ